MKIIAVTNIKGGVGKTTTAVNLAFLCAAGGKTTLLWDLDPQGAATYLLRCEPNRNCPPGISLLSENVLRAADAVIVPLLPTPLSVRILTQLRDFVAASGWTDVVLLPFFSMVDRRKSLHHDVIASSRELFPELLITEVPYSSEIERMSLRRRPIPRYAPCSAGGQIYSALWKEIGARMAAHGL